MTDFKSPSPPVQPPPSYGPPPPEQPFMPPKKGMDKQTKVFVWGLGTIGVLVFVMFILLMIIGAMAPKKTAASAPGTTTAPTTAAPSTTAAPAPTTVAPTTAAPTTAAPTTAPPTTAAPTTTAPPTTVAPTTTAPPAPANNPKITMDEFNRLADGMSYDQVVAIIGGPGELQSESNIAGYTTKMYSWDAEGRSFGSATIMFQNDALNLKSQFGL